ncbi:MAG TPA: glycosyltransferase, partial [Candidatus Eisenbacteria bacterium]|nr:glycosyltransferase [Candidatus Eisenbacteria bacterium]
DLDEQGLWRPLAAPDLLDVPTDRPLLVDGVERRHFRTRWPSRLARSPDMGRALHDRVGEFDVVHVHSLYLYTTLAACREARRTGVPYVVRPHGTLDPYLRRRHRVRKAVGDRLVQRRLLDGAAAIHFTSEDERALAAPLGLRAPGVVVPLGVDAGEFERLPARGSFRARHPGLSDRRLVVFLGRVTPKKGLDLLVRAFSEVAREVPDAHLVIAGPDDHGYAGTVERLVREMRLRDRATLAGMLVGREKLALLADTDVWVLPSYTENFAIAAVEAMACGLPVVISDRVNIHREVAAAGAGLVTGCDAGQVAAAIRRVLDDGALRCRLAAAGPALVRGTFTWTAAAGRLTALYADLAGRPGVVRAAAG